MKITKYPQSCLIVEHGDDRVLVDPGTQVFESHSLDDLGHVDAVLITHRHADHVDEQQMETIFERGVTVFGNADVCQLLGTDRVTQVSDGETFSAAGISVTAHDLPHVPMVNGSAGPPNTGFLLDGRLFHPGDGISLDGLRAEGLAVPIAGASISFRDAYAFVAATKARIAIPIHYDVFIARPEQFAGSCDVADVVVLAPGESTELS